MDTFNQRFSNRWRTMNFDSMMKMNDISPAVQQHLTRTYASLVGTVMAAGVGAYVDLALHLGGLLTTLAGFGLVIYLSGGQDKQNVQRRLGALLLMGFLQGMSLGGLIDVILSVDPSILITALLGTSVIFGCFTLAAMLSKRRSYLFLGGILSSAVSFMLMASLINIFFRSTTIHLMQLYVGLFIFSGYVIFDTQMIIEKANLGDRDFIRHAVDLFVDFVAIFVRIAIILLRHAEKKDDRRRRR